MSSRSGGRWYEDGSGAPIDALFHQRDGSNQEHPINVAAGGGKSTRQQMAAPEQVILQLHNNQRL
jgi:hypothetical protein